MKMKILITSVTVLLMVVYFNSGAQSNQYSPKTGVAPLQRPTIFTGFVTDWLINADANVFDGFNLQTNSEKLMVMFPVHMGSELRKAIKIGNTISIKGFENKDSLGITKINLVSATIDGKTIKVSSPFLAGAEPAKETINGKAKIRELQKNVDGKITGYILDNKTILRLGSNTSRELVKLLIVGAGISYSGVKSDSGSGEDAWASYTIVLCQTITIKGRQYLTK